MSRKEIKANISSTSTHLEQNYLNDQSIQQIYVEIEFQQISNKCLIYAKESALQHGFNAASDKLVQVHGA